MCNYCSICDKYFKTKQSLDKHMDTETHKNYVAYWCISKEIDAFRGDKYENELRIKFNFNEEGEEPFDFKGTFENFNKYYKKYSKKHEDGQWTYLFYYHQ